MVLGLLIFAGIPTTIAVAEGIAEQKKPEEEEDDPKRMAKFSLNVYCDAKSRSTKLINGKRCVLRDNKVYIDEPNPSKRKKPSHTVESFYVEYPDEDREPTRGLVTSISHDPPMLNWIYVDKTTFEVKHGNRSASREHHIGPWDWTEDEEGLTIEGVEGFVAVEEKAGEWAVYYDKQDNRMKGLVTDKKVMPISLERKLRPVEEKEAPAEEPAKEPAKG